jgi:hypothetical protein
MTDNFITHLHHERQLRNRGEIGIQAPSGTRTCDPNTLEAGDHAVIWVDVRF